MTSKYLIGGALLSLALIASGASLGMAVDEDAFSAKIERVQTGISCQERSQSALMVTTGLIVEKGALYTVAMPQVHTKQSCHEQYKRDSAKCRRAPGGARGRAICWATIAAKLGTCIASAEDR